MIQNVFNTTFSKLFNTSSNFNELSKFISSNRSVILVKENLKSLYKEDRISISPINKMYTEFKDMLLDRNNIISLIYIPTDIISNIPQLLNLTHIDIDMKSVKDIDNHCYDIIKSYPEFNNKIIMNISTIYSPENNKIKNLSEFSTRVVKAIISRSYIECNSSLWLNTSIITPLIEIYSWVISYNIARLYNLTYIDQKVIATILAIYFSQKCSNEQNKFVPIYKQISKLGTVAEMNAIENQIIEFIGGEKELSIQDVIKLIKELGPEHINQFSEQIFFRIARTYHINHMISMTSVEYPPYWLYNIITSVSGENKSNIYWSLQKTGLLKNAKDLVKKIGKGIDFDYVFKR